MNSATIADTIAPRPSLIRYSNIGLNQNAVLKDQISLRKRVNDEFQEKELVGGKNMGTSILDKPSVTSPQTDD